MWMKSILFGIVKLLVAIILVTLLFIGLVYGAAFCAADDELDAAQFCAHTSLGQRWEDVERRIRASKADQHQSALFTDPDGAQSAGVTFNSIFPLSRHVCVIRLQGGRVSARENIFRD